jgi:hypothetical protein
MTSSKKLALPLLAACALTFLGCATPKKAAEVDANGKPIEYVYYTPTGSNVPVKIRKDQLAASDSGRDQEALRRIQDQAGRTPQKNNGSGGP